MRTKNSSTWGLNLNSIYVKGTKFKQKLKEKSLLFNPKVPFLYAPKEDFEYFHIAFNEINKKNGIICDNYYLNECKIR